MQQDVGTGVFGDPRLLLLQAWWLQIEVRLLAKVGEIGREVRRRSGRLGRSYVIHGRHIDGDVVQVDIQHGDSAVIVGLERYVAIFSPHVRSGVEVLARLLIEVSDLLIIQLQNVIVQL